MTESKELLGRVFYFAPRDCYRLDVTKSGHRKSFYSKKAGLAGKKDCVRKALDWLASAASPIVTQRTTVDSLYQRYLADKALETVDVRNIKSRYANHIKPVIGGISILQLSRQDLKRVITTAFRVGALSRKSLTNLRGDLSGFCAYLDNSGIRTDLTTRGIKIPSNAKRSIKRTLSAKDIFILFSASSTILYGKVVDDNLINAYRFHVLYGLRPGELMGLQWGDVDGDIIHIRRSINEKQVVTAGKNVYAQRDLPLTTRAHELLAAQSVYRFNANDPDERIFGDYCEITYRERWKLFCVTNGIEYVSPYELRHSFASVNKMLPVWMLDSVMGHAHEGMSLGVYAHSMDGDLDNIGQMLDDNLSAQIERGKALLKKSGC